MAGADKPNQGQQPQKPTPEQVDNQLGKDVPKEDYTKLGKEHVTGTQRDSGDDPGSGEMRTTDK